MKHLYFSFVTLFLTILFLTNSQITICQSVFTSATKVFITEMHIHAWSNHNGAIQPASIQWHAWQADSSLSTDVLWYTEHDGIFQIFDTIEISVDGAKVDANNNIINLKESSIEGDNYWMCLKNDPHNKIIIKGDTMELYIKGSSTQFKELVLAYRNNEDLIKEIEFVKPLAHHPKISFYARTKFPTAYNDTKFEIFVYLAWHKRDNRNQDVLWYKFVPSNQNYSQTLIGNDTVFTVMPIDKKATITLDLYNDAQALQHGTDNTLSDLQLKIGSKNKALFYTKISDLKIYSSDVEAAHIINAENEYLDTYDAIYTHIHQLLGVEYSASDVHMNAFLQQSTNENIFKGTGYHSHYEWSDDVHQEGGIVSYNHLFGLGWFGLDSDAVQDKRSDSTAMALVNNQAFGADYLEVGYLQRGRTDLDRHLKAWDRCTANGLFLYGNGVSDSHGSIWVNDSRLFATYIWANDNSASALLSSLSQGRCFIARPYYFEGKFYFSLANAIMGDRTQATQTNVAPKIYIDPPQTEYTYKLTQILLNSTVSEHIQYVYDNVEFDPTNPPRLDLTKPCFVRIMVYNEDEEPIIISQPIIFLAYSTALKTENGDKAFTLNLYQTNDKNVGHIEVNTSQTAVFDFNIYDTSGKLVKSIHPRLIYAGNYTFVTDLSELSPGAYILKSIGNNFNQSVLFVKNE